MGSFADFSFGLFVLLLVFSGGFLWFSVSVLVGGGWGWVMERASFFWGGGVEGVFFWSDEGEFLRDVVRGIFSLRDEVR